jgi:translocation and assembly module TamA
VCRFFPLFIGVFLTFSTYAAEQSSVRLNLSDELKPVVSAAIRPIVDTARLDDEGDVRQLYRRIRPVIRDVLGAQGYFSPQITRELPPGASEAITGASAGEATIPNKGGAALVVKVEEGERAKIESVVIEFDGALAEETPENKARRDELKALWKLNPGQPFEQLLWDASKNALLSNLLAKDYAVATLADSLADVDPETLTVRLSVVYDSGPVFTFGDMQVKGLSKYPKNLVERYSAIKPGERYEQERLLALLADLQSTAYFSGVDVKVQPDANKPELMPIYVEVTESKAKRLGFGAGYSSNTGFRSEASYSDNNVFNRAYSLVTGVRVEQKRQSAFADLFLPPDRKGVLDSLGVSVDHQDVTGVEIQRSALGASREYQLGPTEFKLGVNYQLEDRLTEGVSLGSTKALVGSAILTRNRVDDRLNPKRGYLAVAQVAAASERLLSDQDFIRLSGRVQQYWSPSLKDQFSARLELGTVIADSRREIPQDYLFRAGGTNSLRGFEFLGVGVLDQGVVQGGRRLVLGSVEYVRWVRESLGSAVFLDLGDVADTWGDIDITPAVGFGVRYRTPAGPIALDIAKAQGENRPRIHFALGVAF